MSHWEQDIYCTCWSLNFWEQVEAPKTTLSAVAGILLEWTARSRCAQATLFAESGNGPTGRGVSRVRNVQQLAAKGGSAKEWIGILIACNPFDAAQARKLPGCNAAVEGYRVANELRYTLPPGRSVNLARSHTGQRNGAE